MIPCVIWNKEALVIFLRLQIALTLQNNPKKIPNPFASPKHRKRQSDFRSSVVKLKPK